MPDENAVARARQSFDGVLGALRDGRALYYQDRNRRWPFHTRARGHALLTELLDAAARLVAVSDVELERLGAERAAAVQREGASIYARKPNKRQEDVTWSQAEYAHAGLQREYCRFKSVRAARCGAAACAARAARGPSARRPSACRRPLSTRAVRAPTPSPQVQRFTETYALLERAHDAGVFRELRDAAPAEGRLAVRVASLGGGPGFELLAFRSFFARLFPHVDAEYISLDLAEEWGPYATRVGGEEAEACASAAGAGGGVRFGVWDVRDGAGLHKAAGGPIDYAIISYVLHHYMCNRECAVRAARARRAPHAAASSHAQSRCRARARALTQCARLRPPPAAAVRAALAWAVAQLARARAAARAHPRRAAHGPERAGRRARPARPLHLVAIRAARGRAGPAGRGGGGGAAADRAGRGAGRPAARAARARRAEPHAARHRRGQDLD